MSARSRFDPIGRRQGRTLGALSAGTQGGTVRGTPSPTPTREPKLWRVAPSGFPLFSADFVRAFWASISDTTVTWINGFFSLADGSQIRSDVEETYINLLAWVKGMSQPALMLIADLGTTIFNLSFLDGVVNNAVSTQVHASGAAVFIDVNTAALGSRVVELGSEGLVLSEFTTAVSVADANKVKLYAKDNGSGKTQIVAQFQSGAAVVIATEP